MPDPTPTIRLATPADLPAINDIYNHYVLHAVCTYQEEPEPLSGRQQWFQNHDERHPVTVAVAAGQVVGWGSLSVYNVRSAYRRTVESSIYVHHEHHRRGIGSLLLRDLIDRARALGYYAIIAGIDSEQTASVCIHTKFGYERVGYFKRVGFKFNRWLDVIYTELLLEK